MKKILILYGLFTLSLLLSFPLSLGALNDAEAYWSFDNVDGGLNPDDLTGNGYDGTSEEGTTTTDNSGKLNQAILYTSDGIVNTTLISMDTLSTGFTLAFWIKTTDTSGENSVLGNTKFSLSTEGFGFRHDAVNGKLDFIYADNGGKEAYTPDVSSVINDGDWHSIIVSYDGTNSMDFYTDNVFVKSASLSTGSASAFNNNFLIGGFHGTTPRFEGSIDEVGLWLKDFTSAERTEFHTATTNPYPSSSVDNYLPINDYHDNNQTIYFSANTSRLTGSCELFLNTTSYGNATINNDYVSKGVTPNSNSEYTWYFDCSGITSTTNSTFVYDTINPIYYEYNLNTDNTTIYNKVNGESYNVTFRGNATDTYLFAWNYTIYDSNDNIVFSNSTTGLTTSMEEIKHTLDIGSWKGGVYTQNVTISDDHTAQWIPDNYEFRNTPQSMSINTQDVVFTIESSSGNLKGVSNTYVGDRYNFGFTTQNNRNEWDFVLSCDETLYYRGNLYPYPVFVCGNNWIDFNVQGLSVDQIRVTLQPNGAYNINIKTLENSDTINFNSVGGLNIITESYTFEIANVPTITLNSLKSIDANNSYSGEFNSTNLLTIEKLELNFTIDSANTPLGDWYFNFTASGEEACSLGNRQSDQCYNYEEPIYKWIQFVENQTTDQFASSNFCVTGDCIAVERTKINNSHWELILIIDEHYNPNVFKNYGILNFTQTKYQEDVLSRIHKDNIVRIEKLGGKFISNSSLLYKLDFRLNISANPPTQPLNAYFCSDNYVNGDPTLSSDCLLIASKTSSEIVSSNYKFRSVFTLNTLLGLDNLKYLILTSDEGNNNRYYSLKTHSKINNTQSYTYYSNDFGNTYYVNTDGYESEANLNWFNLDTAFLGNLYVDNDKGEGTNLFINNTWNIVEPKLIPIVNINYPNDNEIVYLADNPLNITFTAVDFNNDELNISIYVDNDLKVTNLNQSNTFYYYPINSSGNYTISVNVSKKNDPTFKNSDTHNVIVQDSPLPPNNPIIYGECVDVTLGGNSSTPFTLNMSATSDPNGDSFTHNVYFQRGVIDYLQLFNISSGNTLINFSKNKTGLINGTYYWKVTTIDSTDLSNTTNSSCTFDICINNWVPQYTTCINDTQIVTYTDSNNCLLSYDIPSDNASIISCEDNILTDQELEIRKTMLFILFIAFVLVILVQILQLNPLITFSSAIIGILLSIGMYYIVSSEYMIVPIAMFIFQMIILFFNIRYLKD